HNHPHQLPRPCTSSTPRSTPPPPPRPTPFPYTTLFRSAGGRPPRPDRPGGGPARRAAAPTGPPRGGRPTTGRAAIPGSTRPARRSEEHTSELQSRFDLVCRLLLEKKNNNDMSK